MTRSQPLTLLCASFAVATLAGCSNDPELRNQLTPELRNADYPPLLPIQDLVSLQPAPEQQSTQLEQNLNARSDTLQRRADALRRATN